MSDTDSSSGDIPDKNAEAFRVYVSADIDLQTIPALLACEWSEDGREGFDIQSAKGLSAQEICKHHQENVHAGGKIYTTSFLIVDDDDPRSKGVLVVELAPYHGFWDAVRAMPGEAADALASLSIANTDWYEMRDDWNYDGEFGVIHGRFALYDLLTDGDFKTALDAMNEGVQEVGVDSVDEDLTILPGVSRPYHKGVRPDSRDLTQITRAHPSYARSNGLDSDMFAVIDDKYLGEGALFVRVDPSNDSFRCRGPVAGELFAWIFMRFMTWDEAKAFAGRQP